jgi:hypothetical protein
MVRRSGNGKSHDPIADLLTKILDEMRAGFLSLTERADATNARLDVTNARLDMTNARLDNLIATSGTNYRGLDERVSRIERRLRIVKRKPA